MDNKLSIYYFINKCYWPDLIEVKDCNLYVSQENLKCNNRFNYYDIVILALDNYYDLDKEKIISRILLNFPNLVIYYQYLELNELDKESKIYLKLKKYYNIDNNIIVNDIKIDLYYISSLDLINIVKEDYLNNNKKILKKNKNAIY